MLLAQLRVRLVAESELRSRAEKRLRHLVEHDELTDLPNRRALLAHMERRIAAGETGARRGAVPRCGSAQGQQRVPRTPGRR